MKMKMVVDQGPRRIDEDRASSSSENNHRSLMIVRIEWIRRFTVRSSVRRHGYSTRSTANVSSLTAGKPNAIIIFCAQRTTATTAKREKNTVRSRYTYRTVRKPHASAFCVERQKDPTSVRVSTPVHYCTRTGMILVPSYLKVQVQYRYR